MHHVDTPLTNSIAKYGRPQSVVPASNTLAMFGSRVQVAFGIRLQERLFLLVHLQQSFDTFSQRLVSGTDMVEVVTALVAFGDSTGAMEDAFFI